MWVLVSDLAAVCQCVCVCVCVCYGAVKVCEPNGGCGQKQRIVKIQATVTLCFLHDKDCRSFPPLALTLLQPPFSAHFPSLLLSPQLSLSFSSSLFCCPRLFFSHHCRWSPSSLIPSPYRRHPFTFVQFRLHSILLFISLLLSRVHCFVSVRPPHPNTQLPSRQTAFFCHQPISVRFLQNTQSKSEIQVGSHLSFVLILFPRHSHIPSQASSLRAVSQVPHTPHRLVDAH